MFDSCLRRFRARRLSARAYHHNLYSPALRLAAGAAVEALEQRTLFSALPSYISASAAAQYTYSSTTGALQLTSGALTFTADADPTSSQAVPLVNLSATGSGSHVYFDSDEHIAGLSLTDGATATVTPVTALGGTWSETNHDVLVIGTEDETTAPTFNIDSASELDLTDNDMIVHGGNDGSSDFAAVQAAVAVGRNVAPGGIFDGTWTGNGLTSSSAAAADSAAGYEQNVLAAVLNSDLSLLGSYSSWQVGSTVEPLRSNGNDVIVKYTYNGDLHLDGAVDGVAAAIIGAYYNDGATPESDWAFGDMNGDGLVNNADVAIFGAVYGNGASPDNLASTGFTADSGASTGSVVLASFTDTSADAATANSASIAWGDGSDATGTIVSAGGGQWLVEGTHTYSSPGQRPVVISVDSSTAVGTANIVSPPTLATAAAASVSSDGTYINLSVLGADVAGESGLSYTWSTTSSPSGAPAPTFADAGDNSAKDTTAFLQQAGNYTFTATFTNAAGLSDTSSIPVTVGQIATSIAATPASAVIAAGATQVITASELDQFGNPIATQPSFTWAVESGGEGGTVNSSGYYTASTTAGVDAIEIIPSDSSGLTGEADVSDVTAAPAAPTGLTATAAEKSVVLSWDSQDDAATYNVYRGSSASGESTTPIATGLTDPSYTDTGLTDGTTYYYKIQAVNPLGTGSASNEANTAPAPVAPTSVTGTPGDHEIDLSWDAAVGATSYDIFRSTTAGSEGATPFRTGVTATSFADAQSTGTTYYYTVQAVYPSGAGAVSSETSAAAELVAPTAPTGLDATANGSSEIDLSWTPGTGADQYVIERSTDGSTFSEYDEVDGSQTTYQDTGASDGTTYYYQVYASNAVGDSASTSSASASTPLAAPDELTTTPASSTEIDLSWENNSAAATGFTIERSTAGGSFTAVGSADGSATTYNDTELSPGTDYTYQVVASTSSATSAPSASADGLTLPSSLSALTATAASSSEVDLSWTNVTGASGYEVDRKDSDGNWEDVGEVDSSTGTTSGYSDTGLDDGTAYTYQVIPFNDSGDANGSNPSASATTPLIAPDNVVAVALSSTSIEIVWDDESASSTGFEVQRSTDGTNFTDLASTGGADTDYTDTGLTPSTAYAYRVESTNPAAAPSAPSEPASATTPAAPASDAGPQTPTLTAEVVSAGEIELTWPTPTDESNLELEEQGPGDNNFRVVAIPSPTTTDDQTSCSIGGLTAGDQYSFRLRADLNGQEAYSPAVSATPAAVPDGSLPTPTIESMSFLGNAPGDGSGNGPQVFDGDFSVPTPSDAAQATAEANAQSFITAVGLDPYHVTPLTGTQSDDSFNFSAGDNDFHYIVDASPYGYQVSVQLVGGSVSQPSDAYTLNTDGPYPDAPVLTSTPGDDGTVVVSWSQPGDSSSDVNTSLFQLVNGTATPIYQPSDGPSGSTSVSSVGAASQVFAISETAEQGASSYYSNFIDIPPTIPATPGNLSATPYSDSTGSGIRLLWDNSSDNETGFTIQRSTSSDFSTDVQSFTVAADTTSYVDTTDSSNEAPVQPGTTYYYRVEATNDAGASGFSNVVDATVELPTISVTALGIAAETAPNGLPQPAWFVVSRAATDPIAQSISVSYSVDQSSANAATPGYEYTALPSNVTIPAGNMSTVVMVSPLAINHVEPTKSVSISLNAGSTNAVDPYAASASLNITNTDDGSITLGDQLISDPGEDPVFFRNHYGQFSADRLEFSGVDNAVLSLTPDEVTTTADPGVPALIQVHAVSFGSTPIVVSDIAGNHLTITATYLAAAPGDAPYVTQSRTDGRVRGTAFVRNLSVGHIPDGDGGQTIQVDNLTIKGCTYDPTSRNADIWTKPGGQAAAAADFNSVAAQDGVTANIKVLPGGKRTVTLLDGVTQMTIYPVSTTTGLPTIDIQNQGYGRPETKVRYTP